jgi:peroxin-7
LEGLYDVSWSEVNPTVLAAAMADGSVALFDLKSPKVPVLMRKEHGRECSGVEWNAVSKDRFLSTAYDGTIKIVQIMVTSDS